MAIQLEQLFENIIFSNFFFKTNLSLSNLKQIYNKKIIIHNEL